MASILITVLIVSWLAGLTRGVVGSLIGGFVGAAVAAGMAGMASSGELAAYYTPASLARAAVALGCVAAVLALVVPYATGFTALGWALGAVAGAAALPSMGQAAYVLPLALHLVVAVLVLRIARLSAPRA